jgi:chloramphenicol 3-O phosphotransferase
MTKKERLIVNSTLYLLNGASSSGKTSTAKALQNILADPNILLGIDHFHLAIPSSKLDLEHPDPRYLKAEQCYKDKKAYCHVEHGQYLNKINVARFRALVNFLDEGVNVVADEVFWNEATLVSFLKALQGYPVYLIGFYVEESEGERRAMGRDTSQDVEKNFDSGFRPAGLHRASAACVHQHMRYDIKIDTTHLSPEACAQSIYDQLGLKAPVAFQSLCRDKLDVSG